VLLAEVISAGVQLSQIPDLGRGFGGQRRRAGPDLGRADPSRHQCRADDRDPARLDRGSSRIRPRKLATAGRRHAMFLGVGTHDRRPTDAN